MRELDVNPSLSAHTGTEIAGPDTEVDVTTSSLVLTSLRVQSRGAGVLSFLTLLAALLAWLWPIGIGGKMLVGGDVTQFFIGLMSFLGDSLRGGRLPVWNDLWGFGFPGLAESQMGVFYPAHLVLYRWLNTETAYVVSLVLHTLWGGLGTFWAARRLSISPTGSALAAFAWSTCGFFLIHLAHQWGYTTGCWMPWAWGLTWCCLSSAGVFRKVAPFLLSLVLVLQVLPGHFQLAFITQCGVILIVAWSAIERWGGAALGALPSSSASIHFSMRGAGGVVLALAGVFPLAAIQLWPTARLAGLAASQFDFKYLSLCAATPFHLVNFVAPGLFQRSPLWRPLVWTPFHTSPEELLTYVGLAPLFLAGMAVFRHWRRDAAVRLLAILFIATLVLGFGPFAPGFRQLIKLPGFSFFRCPSRWGLAMSLALALLAGKGFDGWVAWPRPGRSLGRFSFAALFWALAIVGLIELAILSASSPRWPALARGFQRVFDAMPWQGDPTFASVMAGARGPAADPRIPAGLNRSLFLQKSGDGQSFATERFRIYAIELRETAALLAALWVIARLSERGRLSLGKARWLLVVVTFLDLWSLGRHRLLDLGPLKPLAEQSSVLAALAREPRGMRVAGDRFKNMPMLIGQAPISAYRTLDLPAVPELTSLTMGPMGAPVVSPLVRRALRATGTGLRVFDPIENRTDRVLVRDGEPRETIEDPALARWLFGESWVADLGPWARTFSMWRAPNPTVRAWLAPLRVMPGSTKLDDWSGDVRAMLAILEASEPLTVESAAPDEWTIPVEVDGLAWVIVSQLADPQWTARWIGVDGQGVLHRKILPAFCKESQPGGWQCIAVPPRGRWTLRLEYDARDVAEGAAISTVAWLSWMLAAVFTAFQAWRGVPVSGRDQID
jgi:hypothetical protein